MLSSSLAFGLLIFVRNGVLNGHCRDDVATLLGSLLPRSLLRLTIVHLLHEVQSSHLELIDSLHIDMMGHAALLVARVDVLSDRLRLFHEEIGAKWINCWSHFVWLSNVRESALVRRHGRLIQGGLLSTELPRQLLNLIVGAQLDVVAVAIPLDRAIWHVHKDLFLWRETFLRRSHRRSLRASILLLIKLLRKCRRLLSLVECLLVESTGGDASVFDTDCLLSNGDTRLEVVDSSIVWWQV